jgi:hypothetical protein
MTCLVPPQSLAPAVTVRLVRQRYAIIRPRPSEYFNACIPPVRALGLRDAYTQLNNNLQVIVRYPQPANRSIAPTDHR